MIPILTRCGISCEEGTCLISRYLMDTEMWATYRRDCPSRTVLEVLANKWALYVLGALRRHDGPMRFSELRRLLDGITQKMLTQTLRALERDGLVSRTVYPTVPPRVEYGLTDIGVEPGQLGRLPAERPPACEGRRRPGCPTRRRRPAARPDRADLRRHASRCGRPARLGWTPAPGSRRPRPRRCRLRRSRRPHRGADGRRLL